MKYCIVTLIAICAIAFHAQNARSSELTKDSLQTVLKNVNDKKAVLVDVREKQEWDRGHVEGAIFLPLSKLQPKPDAEALAKLLPKDKIIYTHCIVGMRSLKAANILEKLGYEVRPLKPGYDELIAAGFKKADDKPITK